MDHTALAAPAAVARLAEALAARNIEMIPVATKAEALAKIKELIPAGATVMNGSSLTLEQIGYTEFAASAESPWVNLHKATALEEDPLKRVALRREASISDYYLGSVSAVTEAGELVIASGSGSQIPGASYNGTHVIFVVGAQKVVPTMEGAMRRLHEHVFPLEDAKVKARGGKGSLLGKVLLFLAESHTTGRTVRLILVQEALGY